MKFFKLIAAVAILTALAVTAVYQIGVAEENGEASVKFFPTRMPSAADGKQIYDKDCLKCHGDTGLGNGHGASSLSKKPPNFTDLNFMRKEKTETFF